MRALLIVLLAGSPGPALSQEPLFLRIRPNAEPALVSGRDLNAEAAQARAAREAIWRRTERRARIAIASVCTGCLKPDGPVSSPAPGPAAPPRLESPPVREASADELPPLADSR